ncbi:hypothetical protein V1277_006515 [Bradyrhizobium sp. AZCC 1588]
MPNPHSKAVASCKGANSPSHFDFDHAIEGCCAIFLGVAIPLVVAANLANAAILALFPSELRFAPLQKRRDAFLVILGHARQRELVDVHVAGEIVERMREAIDR